MRAYVCMYMCICTYVCILSHRETCSHHNLICKVPSRDNSKRFCLMQLTLDSLLRLFIKCPLLCIAFGYDRV